VPLPNRSVAAAKLPTGNSAITNSPLSRWDGNTADGRRVRDLYRGYALALGNPVDTATRALAIAAAEAIAIAENARRDHLAGKVDINSVVRAEGTAARALRRIGMNKIVPPPRKSYIEKLQEQEAVRQAAEARAVTDVAEGAKTAANSDQLIGEAGAQAEVGAA
jgi:hypothetical protein